MKLRRTEVELEAIVRRINDDEIDLQPNFQRGEIWDLKRRQRLVDSVLRGWYVPAIHLVSRQEMSEVDEPSAEDDGVVEVVLDGQQRLAAIRDFFNNEFVVDGGTSPDDPTIASLDGLLYKELPKAAQRRFLRFALPLVTLHEYDPDEPNELFFRLNQSYNLTPSEKRNALHGEARDEVKGLVEDLKKIGLLTHETIGFANGRLAYDDIVARSCVALERANLKLHINNNVVEEFYRRNHSFSGNTTAALERAGRSLLHQCETSSLKLRFNKATLFSWLIFCAWTEPSLGRRLPADMLHRFETHRRSLKRNETPSDLAPELVGPVFMYDDRASYRVTDVSSVLARDCALYLYLERTYGEAPIMQSDLLLDTLAGRNQAQAQQLILEFVSTSSWGELSEVLPR